MQITIRIATYEDIPSLEILIPYSVRTLQAPYYTEGQIDGALGTVFGVDNQLIQDGTYFIAEADNVIVGCGGWSKRKKLFGGDNMPFADDGFLDPGSDPAKIRAFFVHPNWARCGIGSRILQACEAAAIGAGYVSFELVATLAGVPLYAKHGFVEIERYETPLPNGAMLPVVRMERICRY